MSCLCRSNNISNSFSPDYFKNVGGKEMAIYAIIKPLKDCQVPYWCNTLSAYNNSPETGLISLSDPVFSKALPIQAKHSLGLIIDDIQNNVLKPLEYYGTVLLAGGKIVNYDPSVMTGSVNMILKNDFLSNAGAGSPSKETGSGTQNTDSVPASDNLVNKAKEIAAQPVNVGLLLMIFGISALISK